MSSTQQLFTLGTWRAKPGREKEFIAAWEAFAKWTAVHQPGSGIGYLLQDTADPRRFVSYGPWDNAEAINAWRETPEFKAFGTKVRELCEEFQPQSLVLVASSAD